MEGKLVRWGDDLAVRLTADEAQQFGLSEGQVVEVVAKAELDADGGVRQADSSGGLRYENGRPVYTLEDMIAEMRRLGPDFEPQTVDWGPDRGSEIIDDDDPR